MKVRDKNWNELSHGLLWGCRVSVLDKRHSEIRILGPGGICPQTAEEIEFP